MRAARAPRGGAVARYSLLQISISGRPPSHFAAFSLCWTVCSIRYVMSITDRQGMGHAHASGPTVSTRFHKVPQE